LEEYEGAAEVDGQSQFTLILFVGMTVLGLFSEVINKAPSLIFSNVNYVKKVVFPIEILPVVSMVVALFHALISICVILVAMLSTTGKLYVTAILLPVVFFPLITLTLGAAWFLASLGVFLRDVGQTIGLITTALMFLSPVFYPVSAVPERFQFLLLLNPLTFVIEQSRHILIWGYSPDWIGLAQYTLFSVFFAWAGFAWFQKTRRGFADVL
jgi:lipopolysaccharide transport system permease protein